MISWIFAVAAFLSAVAATFLTDMRRSTLALWVTGLMVGGLYMTLGAELLAVLQWILSTAIAISFVFFAAMFGEYGQRSPRFDRHKTLAAVMGFALAVLIVTVLAIGLRGEPLDANLGVNIATADHTDLMEVGRVLADKHFASLEVLAVTLFVAVVGAGVISRPGGES